MKVAPAAVYQESPNQAEQGVGGSTQSFIDGLLLSDVSLFELPQEPKTSTRGRKRSRKNVNLLSRLLLKTTSEWKRQLKNK